MTWSVSIIPLAETIMLPADECALPGSQLEGGRDSLTPPGSYSNCFTGRKYR